MPDNAHPVPPSGPAHHHQSSHRWSNGLVIVDPDIVEPHNVPASAYTMPQIGMLKVEALAALLETTANVSASVHSVRYPARNLVIETPVVVTGLDSITARRLTWKALLRNWRHTGLPELLIDLRSGLDIIELHTQRLGENPERYEATLEGEFERLPCSARAVAYNSFTIAGLATALVRAYAMEETLPKAVLVCHKSWAIQVEC